MTGANTATASVTHNRNGTYTATYTPTLSGADNIAITLGGTAISGSPLTSTVAAGALHHFNVTNTSDVAVGAQTAGTSVNIRVRAKDTNHNTVPSFTGTVVLTSTETLTDAPITTVAYVAGGLAIGGPPAPLQRPIRDQTHLSLFRVRYAGAMRWYAMSDFAMSTAVSAGVGQLARRFVFGATDLYFIDGGDGIATLPK